MNQMLNIDVLTEISLYLDSRSTMAFFFHTSSSLYKMTKNMNIVVYLHTKDDVCRFTRRENIHFDIKIPFMLKLFSKYSLYNFNEPYGIYRQASHLTEENKITRIDWSNSSIRVVDSFKNIPTVILKNCKYLEDVSSLSKCHTVILQNCPNITDVSKLGNVNTLDIRGTGVKNITSLKNVKNLLYDK